VTGQPPDVRGMDQRMPNSSRWITPLALVVIEGQTLRLASERSDAVGVERASVEIGAADVRPRAFGPVE